MQEKTKARLRELAPGGQREPGGLHLYSSNHSIFIIILTILPPHCHRYTWLTWMGMHDHSGYHFPIMYSNEFHDFHHLRQL